MHARRTGRTGLAARQVVLVFGEDANDTKSIAELIVAACPELAGKVRPRARPPILIRDARVRDMPSRVQTIAAIIDVERTVADVICVFAHEDCDAVEPAHGATQEKIEKAFREHGYHVHAVTPAWELETWWFQWPEAVANHRPTWRKLTGYENRNLGLIEHSKEELRRALRSSSSKTRDYSESDSPGIAGQVRRLEIVRTPSGTCASFRRFLAAIDECCGRR